MPIKDPYCAIFGKARYYDYCGFDDAHFVVYGHQSWPSFSERLFLFEDF